ncbi:MAG: hypothetical protein ACN4E6_17480 [Qipengyuania pacifica]
MAGSPGRLRVRRHRGHACPALTGSWERATTPASIWSTFRQALALTRVLADMRPP